MQVSGRKKLLIRFLPVFGCISTGFIYLAIGVIAILSYLRIKQGGADESALVAFLNDYLAGRIFIWIILLGTVCYIAWRVFESISDPYDYGKSAKGLATRIGIALSTIADILIAYTAILSLFRSSDLDEHGRPEEQRQLVNDLLQLDWGGIIVTTIGAITLFTAIVQLIYGISKGYKERIDIGHLSDRSKNIIHFTAWYGYIARAIIVGIIGFFFIKAGLTESARHIVNTDKAFDFIGDHIGGLAFIIVAIGTISYGIFMFALGIAYDVDKG